MPIEIGLLITICGGAVGVATFFIGRNSAAKQSGIEWGEIKSDIKHIKDDLAAVKDTLSSSNAEFKQSISRVYDRMDEKMREHVKQYHGSRNL